MAVDNLIVHEGYCQTWKLFFLNTYLYILLKHTNGTSDGSFMLFDASQQKSTARLISPIELKSAGSCVHFYFNTNGKDVGALKVYSKIGNTVGSALLTTIGNLGDK